MARQTKAADGSVPTQPHPARVYDYLLGGKDNYRVDRDAAQRIIATVPESQAGVLAQRALLGRVVRYLVREAGIRQLLDIGTGLPTRENVHQIAQRIDPATRVVYLDNDPVVLAHAKALLAENPGIVAVDGDLRDPAGILAHPVVRGHLDWTKPVGLLLCGVLHMILDYEHPAEITAALIGALPAGSYVFIAHLIVTDDPETAGLQESMVQAFGHVQFRTTDQVRGFFHGLEFVAPGLVPVPDWRPDSPVGDRTAGLPRVVCAGVARKP